MSVYVSAERELRQRIEALESLAEVLRDALQEAHGALDDYADVEDRGEGEWPRPNKAMKAQTAVADALEVARKGL